MTIFEIYLIGVIIVLLGYLLSDVRLDCQIDDSLLAYIITWLIPFTSWLAVIIVAIYECLYFLNKEYENKVLYPTKPFKRFWVCRLLGLVVLEPKGVSLTRYAWLKMRYARRQEFRVLTQTKSLKYVVNVCERFSKIYKGKVKI